MKTLAMTAALAAVLVAGGAAAQAVDNIVSTFAGAADVAGHGMAEGAAAGPSVFVTAIGHAARPRTGAQVFSIDVQASAEHAGVAAHALAEMVEVTLAAAHKAGVTAIVAEQGFTGAGEVNPMAAMLKLGGDKDDKTAEPKTPKVTAKATIWLTAPDVAHEAGLLDALGAAHLDYKLSAKAKSFIPGLDLNKATDAIEPAVWDEATRRAMIEARRQATLAAGADGAGVGEARQIVILTRSSEPGQVSVTVAVRFALKSAQ
jgi:hypothetical protein